MRLRDLYHQLSTDERDALARAAGTDSSYLYQLATRWRGRRASIPLMVKLADADKRLTVADMAAEFAESESDTATDKAKAV